MPLLTYFKVNVLYRQVFPKNAPAFLHSAFPVLILHRFGKNNIGYNLKCLVYCHKVLLKLKEQSLVYNEKWCEPTHARTRTHTHTHTLHQTGRQENVMCKGCLTSKAHSELKMNSCKKCFFEQKIESMSVLAAEQNGLLPHLCTWKHCWPTVSCGQKHHPSANPGRKISETNRPPQEQLDERANKTKAEEVQLYPSQLERQQPELLDHMPEPIQIHAAVPCWERRKEVPNLPCGHPGYQQKSSPFRSTRGQNSSLVVFGLTVHSVAGSILLWGNFLVEGIFPLELTWVQTPFPQKLFRMRV